MTTRSSAAERERVLIAEDDAATLEGLTELVGSWGYETQGVASGEAALAAIAGFRPSIIISDLVMPGMSGLDLLRELADQLGDLSVVILTAQGTVETAVEAIKSGAYDYLTKPVDPQRLRILLDKVVERQATLREVKGLRRQLRDQGRFGRLVGGSVGIRRVYRTIEQAQTIHDLSPRAGQPYVGINCAAIPETLLESELFGHEKGAFTGAYDRRLGCFEMAHRGTLFLDEIAEMAPVMQVKLLRVLQERRFRRLGGRDELSVDVRVAAATNADPDEAVRSGRLREDLYYRLNVFAIALPPLRERLDDIPLLVQSFLEEFNARNRKAVKAVSPEALKALESYAWPGNVRELRNVIERATILAEGEFIERSHLPPPVAAGGAPPRALTLSPGTTIEEAERRLIMLTLEYTGNNKTRAAEILGISLKTLHNKLNRFREENPAADE